VQDEQNIRAFAAVRIGVGAAAWLAPRLTGRALGIDPARTPQAAFLVRLFGIRDVALGVGLITSEPGERPGWLRVGMVSDLGDALAGSIALQSHGLPLPAGLGAASSGLAAGLCGLALLRRTTNSS
jgi:hypothetical protein